MLMLGHALNIEYDHRILFKITPRIIPILDDLPIIIATKETSKIIYTWQISVEDAPLLLFESC